MIYCQNKPPCLSDRGACSALLPLVIKTWVQTPLIECKKILQLLEIDSLPNLVKEGDCTASASVFGSYYSSIPNYVCMCDVIWQQSPLGLIASSPII